MRQTHYFFVASLAAICLAGFLSMPAIAQEGKGPDTAQTISRVRENVASLHKKLPDFICQEEVSVRETEGAKTIEEKHYLLSLRAVRQPYDPANQFSESREVICRNHKWKGRECAEIRSSHPLPPRRICAGSIYLLRRAYIQLL